MNTDGSVYQADFLVQLLRLHRNVRGLLDQGVDVDFVLLVGPNILEINIVIQD